jgi:hypothetical protein
MQNSARALPSFSLQCFFSAVHQLNVRQVDSSGDLAMLNMCMMLGV